MKPIDYPIHEKAIVMDSALADRDAGPAAVVLASGKGGVGKSVLAVTLGSVLADSGRRVLLLDGSQNLGNLHILLGCSKFGRLDALLAGEVAPEDMISPVGENLWLLPSDSGVESVYSLNSIDRARLHYCLSNLYQGFDSVVVDSGPSIEDVVRLCTIRASGLVIVTMAEPTALADAYAVIKIVSSRVPGLSIGVLVNQVADEAEGQAAFERLAHAGERFLNLELSYIGAVPDDPMLQSAARSPDRSRRWGSLGNAAQALRGIVAERPDFFAWSTTHG
jgi:flagellar biosynthesis protein FlhG